jgi:hypothetical protein
MDDLRRSPMAISMVAYFQQKSLDNRNYPGFLSCLPHGGALPNVGLVCFAG